MNAVNACTLYIFATHRSHSFWGFHPPKTYTYALHPQRFGSHIYCSLLPSDGYCGLLSMFSLGMSKHQTDSATSPVPAYKVSYYRHLLFTQQRHQWQRTNSATTGTYYLLRNTRLFTCLLSRRKQCLSTSLLVVKTEKLLRGCWRCCNCEKTADDSRAMQVHMLPPPSEHDVFTATNAPR